MQLQADALVLGIDLGTGSVKVALMDPAGRVVARAAANYDLVAPHAGWTETDPADWWNALVPAIRHATGDQGARVCAVGLSGQMHGVVLVDGTGQHLRNAILWADRRAASCMDSFRALPQELLQRFANPLIPGMAGPMLCWLRDNEPAVYGTAVAALQPKDWLRMRLTGTIGADPSDASATLLFDEEKDDWALDVVQALGLRTEILAPVSPSSSIGGTLTAEAAAELGLESGLPVAVGAGDVAAAILGSGIGLESGAQISIGSGAQIVVPLDTAVVDHMGRTNLFRAASPGGWFAMAAMQNAGIALERVRSWLDLTWDQAYELLPTSPPGSNDVTFVPYLSGERTPFFDPNLSGGWFNLTLQNDQADLMRAAFEGVAFSVRSGLDALLDAGHKVDGATLTGGGAVRVEWQQMLADVLSIPLLPSRTSDVSARGAAMLGAAVAGWPAISSPRPVDPEHGSVAPASDGAYDAAYERFLSATHLAAGSNPARNGRDYVDPGSR